MSLDDRGPKELPAGDPKNHAPAEKDPKPRSPAERDPKPTRPDQQAPTDKETNKKGEIKVSIGF